MKRILFGSLLASLAAAVGCGPTGTPGGPGATGNSAKPPLYGQADDTFNLTTSPAALKQGDASPAVVGIKRGTNFDQDVSLTFADLPAGVTVEPTSPVIASKSTEAKFTLTAGDAAALGEFTVRVIGHPSKGGDATNQFKLTVGKKDSFTLGMPLFTTGLKQGETKAVSVAISREKKFDQDVTLKFTDLPKGVTVEPATVVIKAGDSDAKFALKAADDAGLGDFTAKVTGVPAKGVEAANELKFTVTKK